MIEPSIAASEDFKMGRRTHCRTLTLVPVTAFLLLTTLNTLLFAQLSIAEKTEGMERHEGYLNFFWDEKEGKIWLEIERFEEEFLYLESLATGLGSNPIGLDRTRKGREKVVRFERHGPSVFLVEPNQRYRAITNNPAEQRAVTESFAQSILWGSRVAAETGPIVLVDATDFLVRDAHGAIGQLRQAAQGDFELDRNRSAVYLPRCKAFPDNIELEAVLTFSSREPGRLVSEVAPTPESPSVRQHHSLIRLPDDEYRPRRFDPRSGIQGITFSDYATALDQPLEKRFISRFRLSKRNPQAAISEPVEPIIYYLDPGAPEPVRSALLEGARWWNRAFEAAGYHNAFRVAMLPEGADPLDVRYNVIQWVHRSTRGWSYGQSVVDPRSGEIIKGHVQLGSLRVRQDRMLIEGLQPLFPAGESGACAFSAGPTPGYLASFDPEASATEVALARIRQLSAHEVGHTLGFAHNFAASNFGRASVMDYPAPLVKINDDRTLNLSEAYAAGIGEWDKVVVRFAYSHFPPGTDEVGALNQIIEDAFGQGLFFVTDSDARSYSSPHGYASLWDNGKDPVAALEESLKVRRIALDSFNVHNLAAGTPLAELSKVVVPVFLHHRYQLAAAAKLLGGYSYTYTLRGDPLPPPQMIEPQIQKRALAALIKTLEVKEVGFPRRLLDILSPTAYGYEDQGEQFPSTTGRIFDPLSATTVAADLTVSVILHPERASRLILANVLDPNQPGLVGAIDAILNATWKAPTPRDRWDAAVARAAQRVALDRLIDLAESPRASSDARATAGSKLRDLALHLDSRSVQVGVELAHVEEALRRITAFLQRPHPEFKSPKPPSAPPGEPIGNTQENTK